MRTLSSLAIAAIAMVAHEANRAYCQSHGDLSQPRWDDAPEWQKDSARLGVEKIASGEVTEPWQSHESWLAQKRAEGWVYGETKDPVAKTHPCMVPYDELPAHQRMKDHLFLAVVRTLLKDIG